MTTSISFASQKGGVGKTTSAVNLSAALAIGGYSVLLIDLDPQGSIRPSFGLEEQVPLGTREIFLTPEIELDAVVQDQLYENLDFILSDISPLTNEQEIMSVAANYTHLLRWTKREVSGKYDFVIIDSPAAMNPLTVNALVASDLIIVPLQCEALAIKSLKRFLITFKELHQRVSNQLKVAGVLMTMYDRKIPMHRALCKQVYAALQESVFQTIIPKCPEIIESSALGQTILNQNLNSIGATAYVRLVNELLDRYDLR